MTVEKSKTFIQMKPKLYYIIKEYDDFYDDFLIQNTSLHKGVNILGKNSIYFINSNISKHRKQK